MPANTTDVPTLEYWYDMARCYLLAHNIADVYRAMLPDSERASEAKSRAIQQISDLEQGGMF